MVIKNGDATLHNVHTYKGAESWFNQAQPKGSEALKKEERLRHAADSYHYLFSSELKPPE